MNEPARDGKKVTVTNREVLGLDDPDIGMCDLCGTEEGHRYRSILTRTFDGEPRLVLSWLCRACKRREAAA